MCLKKLRKSMKGMIRLFKTTYSLLKVFDLLVKIQGRKKLQKMVHLIGMTGYNLPFKYHYHHYGPYSAQLQDEISFMVQQGFLKEYKENEAYVYEITQRGREFREKLEENNNFEIDKDLLSLLNSESSQFLEMVSTYAFLLDSGYDAKDAKLKASELKPHLKYLINDAEKFYLKINYHAEN